MASGIVDLIARIRGMVATCKPAAAIDPHFATLTERAEAIEDELSTLKAEAEEAALKAERDNLKTETQAMQVTLDSAMDEIKRLRAEVGERDWHNGEHDKKMLDVMESIAESATGCQNNTPDAWISFRFDIGIELSRHYIATLVSRGWLRHTEKFNSIILTDKGRAKLAAIGRLK